MGVYDSVAFDRHQAVTFHDDPDTGLRAIVAVHHSRGGRACGGCRMLPYASEQLALDDVLRLSSAMSRKAAMADVAAGGAKAVILAGDVRAPRGDVFEAMGRLVESFGGAYVAAPDVGVGLADLRVVRSQTRWVVGVEEPSAPYTARGVFEGLRAAVRWKLDRDDLDGLRVAVQGAGSVGAQLCALLAAEGARLLVADVDEAAVRRVVAEHGAVAVPAEDILFADADVLSPCALGGILSADTIPRIRARVVAGAANNQLGDPRDGHRLREAGILYAPDYVVSAGGLIAGLEELDGFDEDTVQARIARIGETLQHVFELADEEGLSESEAAERIARRRIAEWRPRDPGTAAA